MTRAFGLVLVLLISLVLTAAAEPAAVAAAPVSALSAQPPLTGTLFYSGQERAKLDKARRAGVALEPDSRAEVPLVINGMVKRGDGNTSVWVDGALVDRVSEALAAQVSSNSVGHPSGLRLASSERLTVTDRTGVKAPRAKTKKRSSSGQPGK